MRAISRDASGETVVMSMYVFPGDKASRKPPPLAVTTSRTAAGSETIVMATSERRTRSASDVAAFAPAATSDPIFAGVLLNTVTSWPFARRFRHIGSPMIPSPTKPTFAIVPASLEERSSRENPALTGLADPSEWYHDSQPDGCSPEDAPVCNLARRRSPTGCRSRRVPALREEGSGFPGRGPRRGILHRRLRQGEGGQALRGGEGADSPRPGSGADVRRGGDLRGGGLSRARRGARRRGSSVPGEAPVR